MNTRSGNTGIVLASLLGLLACVALGAWFVLQDGGNQAAGKPVKPTTEARR